MLGVRQLTLLFLQLDPGVASLICAKTFANLPSLLRKAAKEQQPSFGSGVTITQVISSRPRSKFKFCFSFGKFVLILPCPVWRYGAMGYNKYNSPQYIVSNIQSNPIQIHDNNHIHFMTVAAHLLEPCPLPKTSPSPYPQIAHHTTQTGPSCHLLPKACG